jgi:predicted TPR repeat methyltransferase
MSSLNKAYKYLQQDRLQDANTLLQALIEQNPQDSQTSYLLGLTALQMNNNDEAAKWFKTTIALAPEATPAHYNLGLLYYNSGDLQEAVHHYTAAIQLAPNDNDIRFNLGLACKQLGRLTKARHHFETILQTDPEDTDTLYSLANTEQQLENNQQAISLLELLLQHEPGRLDALNNLGYLYHKEGCTEKAIPIYKILIKNNYNSSGAAHLLASLTGTITDHAPAAYVKDVFDQFADHFDESLQQKLGYNTPILLRKLLDAIQQDAHFQHGLDLGCGTGLSGETFQDCTTALTGIDLSPKMLEQAKTKNIYTDLHESDLIPFIQASDSNYDLYLAADVFVYIGDLKPIFTAIAQKQKHTTFIFSTEQTSKGYTLKSTGRYGHAISYIQVLAKEHGFTVLCHESAPIRKERHKWIEGDLYILQK